MATTAPTVNSFAAAGGVSGKIHGGNQPISGATIRLYSAGTSGYGSAGTLYATTTSANDGYGSFSFSKLANTNTLNPATNSYGCPTSGDPQMYITGNGGNTQGSGNGVNTAAAFIVAIGKCSTIGAQTFVDLNEVTTVGTMAALQQYFNPTTESFGYPNTTLAQAAYANGVTTIANLVNVSTGTVNTSTTLNGAANGGGLSVTATPEIAKINAIANITAACVNNTSSSAAGCTTLFSNAKPPAPAVTSQPNATFATASDVVQATYYMLTNPTSGGAAAMNALFNNATAGSPFQPTLATAPTDWTVGIRYSSTSNCSAGGVFLSGPFALAADGSGNIWIAGSTSGTSTTSNLMELTPNGTPATCALGAGVAGAKGLTIDPAGNVWIASNTANSPFYKYNTTSGSFSNWNVPSGSVPYAVTSDGFGNIFYTDATNSKVNEFVAGSTTVAPTAAVNIASVGNSPYFIAADTAGRVFTVQSATSGNTIYDIYPSTASGNTGGYLTANLGSATNVTNAYALAAGLGGSIWSGNSANSNSAVSHTAYSFVPSATTPGTATFAANSKQYAAGIGSPRGPNAVDGAGNVWYANSLTAVGNYVTGATTSGLYSLSEFSATGASLSADSTSATGTNGGFQKDATIIASAPRSVAIDPTGNVWFGSNSASGQGVVEVVGAAVPVVTPVSAALALGTATTDAVVKP